MGESVECGNIFTGEACDTCHILGNDLTDWV